VGRHVITPTRERRAAGTGNISCEAGCAGPEDLARVGRDVPAARLVLLDQWARIDDLEVTA